MGLLQEDIPYETIEQEILDPLKGVKLTEIEFFVASQILEARSQAPIKMAEIMARAFERRSITLDPRAVRVIVRSLRRNHGFPICTRKGAPAGYYWGRSEAELEEFVNVWKSQYLDEIVTLQQMTKTNYPRLAGQLRLALEE